jgi:hypothetical protein
VPDNETFEDGYRDGWRGVAGDEAFPENPTLPPPGDPATYSDGFAYGRADALEFSKAIRSGR